MATPNDAPKMEATLGLTGVTVNAMALIAPGAFLWITFVIQAGYVFPQDWRCGPAFSSHLSGLCDGDFLFGTGEALSGRGQFIPVRGTGLPEHYDRLSLRAHRQVCHRLGLTSLLLDLSGRDGRDDGRHGWLHRWHALAHELNAPIPGPVFMALVAVIFSYVVAYIAFRGVNGATSVNIAINAIQITVAAVFFGSGNLLSDWRIRTDRRASALMRTAMWSRRRCITRLSGDNPSHPSALSVIPPHNVSWTMLQATIAILLLVGFESVTSMGEEAKNPKRDIPRAVLLSLTIQGLFCYLIEYFAANYFMSSAYSLGAAKGSAAPIGDMMVLIGNALLGGHGQAFMLIEGFTVFLALIGTTLSCINTGARVTYAMGRDEEVPEHFGLLHGDNLTPHRAIWTLATITAVIGGFAALTFFTGGSAPDDKTMATLPHNIWYMVGLGQRDAGGAA